MDTHDWRAQLPPHIRQIKVDEIMSKLKMCQSHGDDDKSLDVQKISQSFKRKIYAGAASQEDYLRQISSMMSLIDRYTSWRAQRHPDSRLRIVNNLLRIKSSSLNNLAVIDSVKELVPWCGEERLPIFHRLALRIERGVIIQQQARSKMVTIQNTIANSMPSNFGDNRNGPSDTAGLLERHLSLCGEEGLAEIHRFVTRFEERIYNTATSQLDYLRKISFKCLAMETRGQNTVANSMPLIGNRNGSSDTGSVVRAQVLGEQVASSEGERNAAVRQCVRKRKQPQ